MALVLLGREWRRYACALMIRMRMVRGMEGQENSYNDGVRWRESVRCGVWNFGEGKRMMWWGMEGRDEEETLSLERRRRRQLSSRAAPPPICPVCGRRAWSPGRCGCEPSVPNSTATPQGPPEEPGPEDCCQSAPPCEHCVWVVYERERAAWEDLRRKRRNEPH